MARYSDKMNRSPRRNQVERVGRVRELPRIRQVRRRPTQPVLQPIYTRFGGNDIVDSGDTDTVTAALFSNQDGVLTAGEFHTSSVQSQSSGEYYLDIYREGQAANAGREEQFSIGYGHSKGSGSQVPQYATEGFTPTRAIHSQYSNLLLSPGDDRFTLTNRSGSLPSDLTQFHFINVQRSRLKERLDPANWELHIGGFGAGNVPSQNLVPSHSIIKLIDDSTVSDGTISEAGTVYKIVSGTIANGLTTTAGINMFVHSASFAYCATPVTMSNQNTVALYNSLSGSAYFAARNKETVHATHYFIRINRSYPINN